MGGGLRCVLLVVAVAGCYSPRLADCVVSCGDDDACPSGLSCVAGMCRLEGEEAPCQIE